MTTTPTAKLTGTELLEAIRANPEFDDAQIVAHCGYTDDAEFYEVLLEARGVELEHERLMMELGITTEEFKANHNKEAVGEHVSCIAALGFRYLTYQYVLDEGFESQKLADQQEDFTAQIINAARLLRGVVGDEAGMTSTDVIGVMTRLFAYIHSGRFATDAEKEAATRESMDARYHELHSWAVNTTAIKKAREIFNNYFRLDQITKYDFQQIRRHDVVATFLRSKILDFLTDMDNAGKDQLL